MPKSGTSSSLSRNPAANVKIPRYGPPQSTPDYKLIPENTHIPPCTVPPAPLTPEKKPLIKHHRFKRELSFSEFEIAYNEGVLDDRHQCVTQDPNSNTLTKAMLDGETK